MFGPGIKQWSHDVPTLRYGNSPYMQKNPYWNYFRNVWGDAPFIDGNFQLWTQGLFKGFNNPDHMIQSQKTLGLPAWMHYYDPAYDPLLDQPVGVCRCLPPRGSATLPRGFACRAPLTRRSRAPAHARTRRSIRPCIAYSRTRISQQSRSLTKTVLMCTTTARSR
jgi:hypothetical protein